jgi:hypothetical protein
MGNFSRLIPNTNPTIISNRRMTMRVDNNQRLGLKGTLKVNKADEVFSTSILYLSILSMRIENNISLCSEDKLALGAWDEARAYFLQIISKQVNELVPNLNLDTKCLLIANDTGILDKSEIAGFYYQIAAGRIVITETVYLFIKLLYLHCLSLYLDMLGLFRRCKGY